MVNHGPYCAEKCGEETSADAHGTPREKAGHAPRLTASASASVTVTVTVTVTNAVTPPGRPAHSLGT